VKTYIVEDSPVILKNLVVALEELAPVQVVGTAADEASALVWLNDPANAADLVIIDIFLKSGSGLGVLRAMQSAGLRGKRVVLTNYATADMRAACLQLGADRVFDKSGEVEELLAYCTRIEDGGSTGPGALN
jgi:DNA-binding NarL/FixJ family response regulator